MTKKFKSKNMHKLDNPLRRKILPPDEIVKALDIERGYKIADVGCGIGYFTIPLAKSVGEEGKVYAIDINPKMLEETRKRVENENLKNVEIIQSAENNFKIGEDSVDILFTSTVFHELDNYGMFLNECKRVLKNKGYLIMLDWNKIEEEMGPPIHKRIDVEDVKNYLLEAGFHIENVDYIGNSFYIIKGVAN